MNVLIIPEDFRNDQFIVGPLIQRMLAEVGKPRAKVRVCRDPLLGGVGEALKWERISEIIDRYRGTIHLFLLVVDRDGIAGRRRSLDALESKAAEVLTVDKGFFGENARQEIEVWATSLAMDVELWAERRRPTTRASDHAASGMSKLWKRESVIGLGDREDGQARDTRRNPARSRRPREPDAAKDRSKPPRGITLVRQIQRHPANRRSP
jgi:hypothetical protein